jgi:hypothetical protein
MFNTDLKLGDQVQVVGIVGPVMIVADILPLPCMQRLIHTVWFEANILYRGQFNVGILAKINE